MTRDRYAGYSAKYFYFFWTERLSQVKAESKLSGYEQVLNCDFLYKLLIINTLITWHILRMLHTSPLNFVTASGKLKLRWQSGGGINYQNPPFRVTG